MCNSWLAALVQFAGGDQASASRCGVRGTLSGAAVAKPAHGSTALQLARHGPPPLSRSRMKVLPAPGRSVRSSGGGGGAVHATVLQT